jgi:23S rRNA pseudouridine2605 synthase
MPQERLQKILARGGIASRRAAEDIIKEGRVRVNGRVVTELGVRADPRHDRVELDGKRVVAEPPVYFVINKPRGFVTTLDDPEGRRTVADLLRANGVKSRVFPVGRLDFHTSGVLLLTNDGAFSDGLLHPRRAVPKTYVVKVDAMLEPKQLDVWRDGVMLEDGKTLPAEVTFLRHEGEKTWFEITIREGRNQQIRRMGEATGAPVMRLSRLSFAGITIDGLKPGGLRPLKTEELIELKKAYGVPKSPGAAPKGPDAAALTGRRAAGTRGAKRAELKRRKLLVRGGRDAEARAAGADKRANTSTGRKRAPRFDASDALEPSRGAERAERGDLRGGRAGARAARPERIERGERGARAERFPRTEHAGARGRFDRAEAGERTERPARGARGGQSERGSASARGDARGVGGARDRAERPRRSGPAAGRDERFGGSERGERPQRGERRGGREGIEAKGRGGSIERAPSKPRRGAGRVATSTPARGGKPRKR